MYDLQPVYENNELFFKNYFIFIELLNSLHFIYSIHIRSACYCAWVRRYGVILATVIRLQIIKFMQSPL